MLLQAVADGRRRPTILVNKRLFNGCRQGTLFNHYKMGFYLELLSYRMIVDISIMSMCMAVLLIMSVLLN